MREMEDKFLNIIQYFCKLNGLNVKNLIDFIGKAENKYLLLLIINRYGNINDKRVNEILRVKDRTINLNLRKAEEKILISRNFRKRYFELEDEINKII